jgi:hypothetical protein
MWYSIKDLRNEVRVTKLINANVRYDISVIGIMIVLWFVDSFGEAREGCTNMLEAKLDVADIFISGVIGMHL